MAHLLFLSHAGADTERALRLAAAIEASPEAQAAGLEVWLDKRPDGPHRLRAGTPWQDQLERAIAAESTAFGLLLTREGARDWVRLEVQVALDRVVAEQRQGRTYPFVPIIAEDANDLAQLPPFARVYHGVELTKDGQGLADLIRVAARLDNAQSVRLVSQPFKGLEAFEAKDAALFFGRRAETQALVDRLRTTNLVLVTGDSGSGKSSLVKAGLIPAFREGALADPLGRRPEPGQWHVVEMRPGSDPFEGLVEGTQRAATAAGIAPEMIFALGAAIRARDPGSIRDALRQSGPSSASLLLVVDQFEELWTLTLDDAKRRDFLAALLALAPEGELARRVVGTMRRDYYHLHTDDEHLRDRLAAKGNAGRFLLGAMAPQALRDIVEKPLLLAGESRARASALADEVVKDVAGEPGNLALVEMALHESWERRHESGGDLALAYQRLDRLEGALARAAEDVYWNPTNNPSKLAEAERPIAEALFMRLVRASDAGGATRRQLAFIELDNSARTVARKIASPECRRLLVLQQISHINDNKNAFTVELAHEQLATQWPDYRHWLNGNTTSRHKSDPTREADKRALDRLMDATQNWLRRGRNPDDLSRGGDLSDFIRLRDSHSRRAWLSEKEAGFISASLNAEEWNKKNQQTQRNEIARSRALMSALAIGVPTLAYLVLLFLVPNITSWLSQWSSINANYDKITHDQLIFSTRNPNWAIVDDNVTQCGRLIADAIKSQTASDVAVVNMRSLLPILYQLNATQSNLEDTLSHSPNDIKVVLFDLSGRQILAIMQKIFSRVQSFPNTSFNISSYPQISGALLIVEMSPLYGLDVDSMFVGREAVELDKTYSVATIECDDMQRFDCSLGQKNAIIDPPNLNGYRPVGSLSEIIYAYIARIGGTTPYSIRISTNKEYEYGSAKRVLKP